MKPVLTGVVGTNENLIAEVAKIHLKPNAKIADITYGRGVFWNEIRHVVIPLDRFFPSDLSPQFSFVKKADFKKLPYANGSMNVVVFDPPYMHSSKYKTVKNSISKCYKNNEGDGLGGHVEVVDNYRKGIREAHRILAPTGLLWVKCQDEIQSGHQRWSHIEILAAAEACGFKALDLFVLVSTVVPVMRWKHQLHARKNHSYLWILRKETS